MKILSLVFGLLLVAVSAFAGPGDYVQEGPDKTLIVSDTHVPGVFYIDITMVSPDGYDNTSLITLFGNQLPSGLTLYITGVSVYADDSAVNYSIFSGASQYARSESGATTEIVQDGSTDTAVGDLLYADFNTGATTIPANLPIYFKLTDTATDVPDEVRVEILGYFVKE